MRCGGASSASSRRSSIDHADTSAPASTTPWIRTIEGLARLTAALAGAGEIALDTEGDSLHHYPERLSLIQLADRAGRAWLIDPLAIPHLGPLGRLLAHPGVVVVLHAGDNDLAHLKRRHGFAFAAIFDTSIAARFLGAPALGLDVLLAQHLGVELPPSRQKDDWSARPLSKAQERYAVADVQHLIGLKDRLVDELQRVGRVAWVAEECAALASQPVPERVVDPEAFAEIKGARELAPRALAALRELYELREQLAVRSDRPPFKILGGDTLVRLAVGAPADPTALAAISGCTPRVIARWGEAIQSALARAAALPDSALPRLERRGRPPLPARVRRRIEALRQWRTAATPRFGLEAGVLLP
ncbi:MAG: ribonuclease D, partial [Candidatus Rokuibacteriota bacterium]